MVRSLAITRSKIAKKNIISHEALAGKLNADALYCVLQPLVYDIWDKPLLLPFKTDSTCCLAMMTPAIHLKNMLLSNAVAAFKDELVKISIQFPKSLITALWDTLSELRTPVTYSQNCTVIPSGLSTASCTDMDLLCMVLRRAYTKN